MISISFNQFLDELKIAVFKRVGWAHIRYGDGEGIVMRYPHEVSHDRANKRWLKWLGVSNISIGDYAREIQNTVKVADVVGIPCKRHMKVNDDWRAVLRNMVRQKLLGAKQKVCCMDNTVIMSQKGLYADIIRGADVYCISCRDVTQKLIHAGARNVINKFIPPQASPRMGRVLAFEKHYPDLYNEITNWIQENACGNLFLVGAGGLGKIYCAKIKLAGGVAIDIGSLFDGWAGLKTRTYLDDFSKFLI